MSESKIQTTLINKKEISSSLYLLYLDRKSINFKPGQHITLSIPGEDKSRLYSIASGNTDEHLELLIREISYGDLSIRFKQLMIHSPLQITKPVGYFCLPEDVQNKKIICIATGSGIAPFRSFSKSHLNLDLTIIHGIRDIHDSLIAELPTSVNYITCTSKTREGDYFGRVTNYIKEQNIDPKAYYYLCGNGEMIHEIYLHLKKQKVSRENIFYEEYFNN